MLRVIFLTGNLEAGGLERFVTRVACFAKENKVFEPFVICLSQRSGIFYQKLRACEVEVLEAPKAWQRNPVALFKLGKLVRSLHVDIVHSQVNFSLVQQWMSAFIGGARFMVTERNMYPLKRYALWRRRLQFFMLKFLGVEYSANSGEVALHLSKMIPHPVNKIPVVTNGINISNFSTSGINSIRQRYGWSAQDVVIGYTARLTRHKGQRYFLEIFKELAEKQFPVKACLVGDGPDRTFLENWVFENQLASLVTFTGIIKNTEEIMGSFDICALLSEHEGMPNVVMEAMASGKPVVAHQVGNVSELFRGGAGIIVPLFDKEAATEAFIKLITDTAKRKETGILARKKIQAEFSLNIVVTKLMSLYQA